MASTRSKATRQASPRAWSPRELITAIQVGGTADDVAILKRVGIVDKSGKLARKYKSWGTKVSRTEPVADDPSE